MKMLNDTYSTEDMFMCEDCETFGVTFTPGTVEFDESGEFPVCPCCGQGMEEDCYSGSDGVDEERAERQQMGLTNF